MPHTLPDLPFDPAQMTPFCSKETFEYHHDKHHAAYVTKLNDALQNSAWAALPLEELIKKAYQENDKIIFNNAAQHFNHSFFWDSMTPNTTIPGPKMTVAINRDFGSLEKFKELFSTTAASLFGSGWVWLVQDQTGKLKIIPMKDADSPLIIDKKPIITLDVWEHAYYIDFRNRRPDYIRSFWDFLNWSHGENLLN